MNVEFRGCLAASMIALAIVASGCAKSTASRAVTPETTEVVATTTESTTAPPLTTTVPAAPVGRLLEAGLDGDDVTKLQTRLNEIAFDVRKPDSYFGEQTKKAIWSYQQRVLGLPSKEVTGKVTPALFDRIMQPLDLPPRRPDASPTHAEIDLPSQTMVVYVDKQVKLITHISSGSGEKWCAQPRNVPDYIGATTTTLPAGRRMRRVCGISLTPAGVYKIDRKEKGWYDIPLGKVYNPMFFNGGIAIHGYEDIPFLPASHGCVRIPMHVAEYIGDILHTGDQIFVFDGLKEPEEYGSPVPPQDKPDPTDTSGG
jgi:peptidoglycan hydrolase-like protein with peptidoglycan-binding domain